MVSKSVAFISFPLRVYCNEYCSDSIQFHCAKGQDLRASSKPSTETKNSSSPTNVRRLSFKNDVVGYDCWVPIKGLGINTVLQLLTIEEVSQLLKIYLQEYGELRVKRQFIVPNTSVWPSWSHGFEFGLYTERIRNSENHKTWRKVSSDFPDLYNALNKAGFLWKHLPHIRGKDYEGFERFIQIYGHLNVTRDFVVPRDTDLWDRKFWGMRLGKILDAVRNDEQCYIDLKNRLPALGLDHTKPRRRPSDFKLVEEALMMYKLEHGHINVPQNFTIPLNDSLYPAEMSGFKLGQVVNGIRNLGYYSEHKKRLKQLGFDFDLKATRQRKIYRAFKSFKDAFGITEIPRNFIVPRLQTFPYDTWDLRLGDIYAKMKCKSTYKGLRSKLQALGFFSRLEVTSSNN